MPMSATSVASTCGVSASTSAATAAAAMSARRSFAGLADAGRCVSMLPLFPLLPIRVSSYSTRLHARAAAMRPRETMLERLTDAERDVRAVLTGREIEAERLAGQQRRLHADADAEICLQVERRFDERDGRDRPRLERRVRTCRRGRRRRRRRSDDRRDVRRVAGIGEQRDGELLVRRHRDAKLELSEYFAIAVEDVLLAAQLLIGQAEERVVRQRRAAARE